jgi:mannose-6-phosphate isomerase-like protein (cupin superfamily)
MKRFNQDELIDLLIRYFEGTSSQAETRYIRNKLQADARARELWEDVKATFSVDITHLLRGKKKAAPVYETPAGSPLSRAIRQLPRPADLFPWMRVFFFLALIFTCLSAALMILGKIPDHTFNSFREPPQPGTTAAEGSILYVRGEADVFPDSGYTSVGTNVIRKENRWNCCRLVVPKAHTFKLKLPDGTRVHVNADSRLRFPTAFSRLSREVHLEGEAYFEVQPDPDRAFIVHTGKGTVTALGTSFNVNTYDGNFNTSLVSGQVIVYANNRNVELKPGQAAIVENGSKGIDVRYFDHAMVLGQLDGRYPFVRKPLAEVCKMVERLYGVSIIIDREEIAATKYTGVISKKEPLQVFLENLKLGRGLACYRDEHGKWHLY